MAHEEKMSELPFEWKINDAKKVREMKNAAFKQAFVSPKFSAFGCEWYLDVYPKGYDEQGFVQLYLTLSSSLPANIQKMDIVRTLKCEETNTQNTHASTYDRNTTVCGGRTNTRTPTIANCARLTFVANLELGGVYDKNGADLTEFYLQKYDGSVSNHNRNNAGASTHQFAWNISDALQVQEIKSLPFGSNVASPIFTAFGFRWFLKVSPNGFTERGFVALHLCLASVPPKIKSVEIDYAVHCVQSNTKKERTHKYEEVKGRGWLKFVASAQIENCDSLSFIADLELKAIVNANGDDVTQTRLIASCVKSELKAELQAEQATPVKKNDEQQVVIARLDSLASNMEKMMQKMSGMETRQNTMHQEMKSLQARQKHHANAIESRQKDTEQLTQLQTQMKTLQQTENNRIMVESKQKDDANAMSQKMNAIEARLDHGVDEQKDNDQLTQLQTQMNTLQQKMDKLMARDMTPEQQQFKAWLDSTGQLAVYYDLFVDHGVTDFGQLSKINMQDIRNMGIDNIHHQMMILNKVLELHQNQDQNDNQNGNEGNTALLMR